MGKLADLLDRLNSSDLIIGKHDGDQDGIRTDGLFQLIQLYHAVLIHRQVGYLKAMLLQPFAGMQDRMMLDLRSNDVLSLALVRLCGGLQGPVVGLAAAGGKIDFLGLGTQGIGNGLSRLGDGLFALTAQAVYRRRIAVMLCKIRQHRLYDLRRRLRRRRIIQIN